MSGIQVTIMRDDDNAIFGNPRRQVPALSPISKRPGERGERILGRAVATGATVSPADRILSRSQTTASPQQQGAPFQVVCRTTNFSFVLLLGARLSLRPSASTSSRRMLASSARDDFDSAISLSSSRGTRPEPCQQTPRCRAATKVATSLSICWVSSPDPNTIFCLSSTLPAEVSRIGVSMPRSRNSIRWMRVACARQNFSRLESCGAPV